MGPTSPSRGALGDATSLLAVEQAAGKGTLSDSRFKCEVTLCGLLDLAQVLWAL